MSTFTSQGKITVFGAIQPQVRIALAAVLDLTGRKQEAITQLEQLKRTVNDSRIVRDPGACDTLIREADAVIASLRITG